MNHRNYDDAERVFRDVVSQGDLDNGLGFMRKMEREGISPNVVTYNTLMDASYKKKMVKETMAMLRAMEVRGIATNLILI